MKEAQAARYRKPVVCLETGVEYSCAKETAEKMGLSQSSIRHNIKGRNKSVKGFAFAHKTKKEGQNKS